MRRNQVEPDAVSSYRRSFHYKAITFGSLQPAVCPDCHTAHRILPPTDPKSSVAPAALPATCGQTACHAGARASFAVSGANHLDLRVKQEPMLAAEEWLFWSLTTGTLTMLGMGILHDVQKKFGWVVLLNRVSVRLGRQLRAIAISCRRSVKFVRWLLVE